MGLAMARPGQLGETARFSALRRSRQWRCHASDASHCPHHLRQPSSVSRSAACQSRTSGTARCDGPWVSTNGTHSPPATLNSAVTFFNLYDVPRFFEGDRLPRIINDDDLRVCLRRIPPEKSRAQNRRISPAPNQPPRRAARPAVRQRAVPDRWPYLASRLPRNDRLVRQLTSLERTTARGSGRDNIDHPPGQHDDVSNCVAGSAVLAAAGQR